MSPRLHADQSVFYLDPKLPLLGLDPPLLQSEILTKTASKVKLCYGHYIVKFRDYDHLNFRQICFSDNLTLKPFRYYDHHSLQRPLDSKTGQLFKPFDINIGLLVLK